MVLGPGDSAQSYAGFELLVVDAETLERLLHDGLLIGLVVDGEGAGQANIPDAKGFDVPSQNTHAEAVEGGQCRLRERGVAEDFFNALGHLFGGLVGEGDGKDVVGRNAALLYQISNAVSDDARFAGAGAGEQQHGAIDRQDALALLRIHVGEKVGHNIHFIRLRKPSLTTSPRRRLAGK